MEFSNMSPFHSEDASPLNDEIKKIDRTFDHFIKISKWDASLEEASERFLASYNLLSLIKAKIGTKEQGTLATELTFGSPDSDYINSYQKNWIRDEHIEQFYGMKFGPKSFLQNVEYSKSEIEDAIEHHISIILPNQPEAQIKYFNYFKSNYEVVPPLSARQLNDMQVLWNIIHQCLEIAFEVWISDIAKAIAAWIRTFKIVDENSWRYLLPNGEKNEAYDPYLPVDSVELFASGILTSMLKSSKKILGVIESIEQFTEESVFFVHTIVVTVKKLFVGINKFIHFLLSLLEGFIDVLAHINAFFIGIYNGIIEFIASLFDLLEFFTGLMKKENRTAFIEGIDEFYEKYEKEGLWSIIKEILDTFIQKYKDAPDSYDVAKYLGEDIIQIIIEILITAATGGGAAIKRLGKILADIKNGVFRQQLKNQLKNLAAETVRFIEFILEEQYEIIIDYVKFYGAKFASQMKLLAAEGVSLAHGILKGEKIRKYFLIYKGIILRSGNRRRIINEVRDIVEKQGGDIRRYLRKAHSDPTFRIWGAGKDSHPELWKKIIEDLEAQGVEIKFSEKNMVYGPHPAGGAPGMISIPPDASITALMHEAKHFYDDLAQGFKGFRLFESPNTVWQMEFDAYMEEIDFLRKHGEFDAAQELLENARIEKLKIEKDYGIKL
ncbi:MAG: hypothetical protein GQ574_25380 [Crocinitomix sp.]|nr:hypothetical protein [Crocinitomix sp.]